MIRIAALIAAACLATFASQNAAQSKEAGGHRVGALKITVLVQTGAIEVIESAEKSAFQMP